jgi:SAM-dependent methyltransferase
MGEHWHEDDEFWQEVSPFLFSEEKVEAAGEEIAGLLSLIGGGGGAEPGAALDLCCGPGRHAVELAKRGWRVTGVDRTEAYLAQAGARAEAANVAVEWVVGDMRTFVRPAAFDLVVSLYTSFGYFDDEADNLHVLDNMRACLKPGGSLVMELAGKEWLAGVFRETDAQTAPDGSVLVQRRRVEGAWERMANDWILIRDGHARTFSFTHTLYSGVELRDRLVAAGFVDVRILGSLEGAPYDRDATRLVAVARA